jgi:alpha-D-xyloside xylohydrolase
MGEYEANKPPRKKRRWWVRLARALAVLLLLVVALVYFVYVLPFWGVPFNQSRHGRVPVTPPWALECWLWEDDVNTGAYVKELLEGYAKYDIPVRTILIDSPWSWRYNDFKVDETRYPEPEKFFRGLQDQGYRVVLWMTCMVDSYSKDTKITDSKDFYEEARAKGYLAGRGVQYRWWKGRGGFIDYSNPEAMKWWHGLQQQVLDWGVDGWKLDGCDTFFSGRIGRLPVPFNRAHAGWMTTRQYMDHYAREELAFGQSQNPDFVIMVRAKDQPWSHPEGFSPLDAATVTWVGDNRHTWNYQQRGLEGALRDILDSARLGYCVIGSDVAGYHGRSNPDDVGPATAALLAGWKSKTEPPGGARLSPGAATSDTPNVSDNSNAPNPSAVAAPEDGRAPPFGTLKDKDEIAPNIYIRWAEFSAFCGFFLNGGHGERRLWKRTQPELEIVRKFSWLHTELVPYIYSQVVNCHHGGPPLMRPLANGRFHYMFGDDFLVAPIHQDTLTRAVSLPAGKWRYLFDDHAVVQGPTQLTREFPLDEYPVYVREGAVVPLKVQRAYTGLGDPDSAEFTTWLIYPAGQSQFTLWHPESHPKPEATTVKVAAAGALNLEFSGKHEPHLLRISARNKPSRVTLDGKELAEGAAWKFDAKDQRLIIKTREYTEGKYLIAF